jgi:putative transposase
MAWGTVKVDDQRVRFVVSANGREKTMRELCEEFEISRPTGYEWLRRYRTGGIAGVVETMGARWCTTAAAWCANSTSSPSGPPRWTAG